jgi:hypothetical protein
LPRHHQIAVVIPHIFEAFFQFRDKGVSKSVIGFDLPFERLNIDLSKGELVAQQRGFLLKLGRIVGEFLRVVDIDDRRVDDLARIGIVV